MSNVFNLFEEWKKNNQYGNQNPFLNNNLMINPFQNKIEAYTPNKINPNISNFFAKKDFIIDKDGNKRSTTTGQIIVDENSITNQEKLLPSYQDDILKKGKGVKEIQDPNFLQKLSSLAGVDYKIAAKNWEKKGGFEGLMANPGFTLGLALMQSAANGKTINEGILDNFITAGGLSAEFADRIEDRKDREQARIDAKKQEPIQSTSQSMSEMKSLLAAMGISEGNWLENLWKKVSSGGKAQPGLEYDLAVEELDVEFQEYVKGLDLSKTQSLRTNDKIKLLKKLIDSGKIKLDKNFVPGFDKTLRLEAKAHGGPVEAGKPYIVGEQGPEIIIPTSNGNVLTNDDSQIYAMLLSANPQLQNVSRQRAEKIIRARFPEYFEG